jgi:hypothetical protein
MRFCLSLLPVIGSVFVCQGVLHAEGDPAPAQKESVAPAKKKKPHFAGARRPDDTPKPARRQKRVKSPWYQSKTQPKTAKKEADIQDAIELPEERPHFIKTSGS